MWQLSERFCSPPFCWSVSKTDVGVNCHKNCESPADAVEKYDLIEKVCQNDVKTVAIKTIRFWNMAELEPLFAPSYDLDFRVVVLVRDPRYMVSLHAGMNTDNLIYLFTSDS